MGKFAGIVLSDIERIDLRIKVKTGIVSIFGKVYLNDSFDIRVFGFEEEIFENDLPVYLEKMESDVSGSGIEFKHSTTRWGWLMKLEKAMWRANVGDLLPVHTCPACVVMESAFFE